MGLFFLIVDKLDKNIIEKVISELSEDKNYNDEEDFSIKIEYKITEKVLIQLSVAGTSFLENQCLINFESNQTFV